MQRCTTAFAALILAAALAACSNKTSVEDSQRMAAESFKHLPDSEKPALIGQLHGAAQRGDDEAVRKCLSRGVPPDSHPSGWWTPLMEAVAKGHESTAELLIDRGADVNARLESNGMTVLMIAALNKKPRMAKLLLDRGANVQLRDNSGSGVRSYAEASSNKEIIGLVKKAAADW